MNKHFLKTTVFLVVLSITCMLQLSSCQTIMQLLATSEDSDSLAKSEDSDIAADPSTVWVPSSEFHIYGYDFSVKSPNGKTLCYRILNDNEVGCITPVKYYDPTTKLPVAYRLSGNVVIPKTVTPGKKTYTVAALLGFSDNEYAKYKPPYKSVNAGYDREAQIKINYRNELRFKNDYFGSHTQMVNLVIPETVKAIEFGSGSGLPKSLKNVISYSKVQGSLKDKYPEWDIRGPLSNLNVRNENCVLHVPHDSDKRELKGIVMDLIDYDIYVEGHSVEEYLSRIEGQVLQRKYADEARKRSVYCTYDFATENKEGVYLYFRIKDENTHSVALRLALAKDNKTPLIIPETVNYNGKTYTVTDIDEEHWGKYMGGCSFFTTVVIPRAIKNIPYSESMDELIFYSPDAILEGNGKYGVLHVPQGTVEKYHERAELAIVEIVDNYSIYDNSHSYEGYMSRARRVVDEVKAVEAERKEQEKIKRQEEAQAAKEAELKKVKDELSKQYGAKYVNALFEGKLIVGMPANLFAAGIKEKIFTSPHWITRVELEHDSKSTQCYRLYGYKNTSSAIDVFTTPSILLGWVWIKNDKVSSISWK